MATLDRIECTLTLVGLKPTCGPDTLTASWSFLEISVIMIVDHFTFLDTATSRVRPLVPFHCRCATRLLIAATANSQGLPVSPCTIDFSLAPLF